MSVRDHLLCVIEQTPEEIRSYLIGTDDRTIESSASQPEDTSLKTGDILLCRVRDVVRGIHGAFLDGPGGEVCFIDLSDEAPLHYLRKGPSERIQQGDEIIVQVKRPAVEDKKAMVSATLSRTGHFAVISSDGTRRGVSRKITGNTREACILLDEDLCAQTGYGIVLRTAAAEAEAAQAVREVTQMASLLDRLLHPPGTLKAPQMLQRAPQAYLSVLSHISGGERVEVVTDRPELLEQAKHCSEAFGLSGSTFTLHQDRLQTLSQRYALEQRKQDIYTKRVRLRSGAWLMIEPTTAMTVIDVNSGQSGRGRRSSADPQQILKVNLEAAREIARQLRLRNIFGIIVIDFINMDREEDIRSLRMYMQELAASDPMRCCVEDVTGLQLMELTRMKA